MGLKDTRHIAKIRVHPEDPELVYVAALGHVWGPNEERGNIPFQRTVAKAGRKSSTTRLKQAAST